MLKTANLFRNPSVQKFFKSALIYASGDFLNKVIPFILIPVLTRLLSTEDYGIIATFMAILGIVQIIISMGTVPAIMRGYFDREKENFVFSEFVFSGLVINFTVFFIIILLWLMLKSVFTKLIPIPFGFQLLIPLIGFFSVVATIPSQLWVYMKKPLPYAVFNASRTLLEIVFSIWLIVSLGLGWDGRIFGIFAGKALYFLIGIYILLKSKLVSVSLNVDYIKNIICFGAPVVLHSLGYVMVAAIDRFFLNAFINLSTTGIYSVSYSICTVIMFATGAVHLALSPAIYEKLGNATDAFKQKLVKYTYCYFFVTLVGVAAFIFFVPGFLNIYLGERFLDAKKFIFWLALGFGFYSMYITVVMYIWYSKKTVFLSIIAVAMIVLSIVSNYVLIKLNGAVGVAQATCIVFFSQFLMAWYASNKVYPLPWLSFMKRVRAA